VLGTHGRGIWIIDDISSLRSFDTGLLTLPDAAFLPNAPGAAAHRSGVGGWSDGDAVFVGPKTRPAAR
jgi:hypothetical protein